MPFLRLELLKYDLGWDDSFVPDRQPNAEIFHAQVVTRVNDGDGMRYFRSPIYVVSGVIGVYLNKLAWRKYWIEKKPTRPNHLYTGFDPNNNVGFYFATHNEVDRLRIRPDRPEFASPVDFPFKEQEPFANPTSEAVIAVGLRSIRDQFTDVGRDTTGLTLCKVKQDCERIDRLHQVVTA